MNVLRRTLMAATMALLAPVTAASAQRVDPMRLIDFHVNAEQKNVSFSGTEHEGGKFTITLHDTGQTYALSMVQRGENRFEVTVLRRRVSGNDTSFTALETVRATQGRPAALTALPYYTVVIDGTRRANAPVSSIPTVRTVLASYTQGMRAWFGTCCVTCGQVTACGCAVKHDCGSCCSDDCCPKQLPEVMLPREDTEPLTRLGQRPCKTVPDAERIYPQFRPASGALAIRS